MYDLTVLFFLSEMKTHYLVDIEELSLYYQGIWIRCGIKIAY
jgi:hypothetical protein